jgi:GcrA cell cycle regulator
MAGRGAGVRHGRLPPWPAEDRAKLELLWAEGLSSGVIAETLGRSRNAVVGMKARLGLSPRPSPIRHHDGSPPPQRQPSRVPTLPPLNIAAPAAPRQTPVACLRADETLTPDAVETPPEAAGLSASARTCQWVNSDRRPWAFCGCPARRGTAWCEAHYRCVYSSHRHEALPA